jgi:signal transduction histidine kinase
MLSDSLDLAKGQAFLDRHNDSAFYYFNEVTTKSKDSLQVATAYSYMASLQSDAGDYFGAQESLTLSLRFLNEQKATNRYCLASDYNELAMTSSKLKNYDKALEYNGLAENFSDDQNFRLVLQNNRANLYQRKKAYRQAIPLYETILRQTKPDGKEYARTLTNLAGTIWLSDPLHDAVPELKKALRIRLQLQDFWGQNSSFSHLADFYARSHPDSALLYARKMLVITRMLRSPDDELEALDKLIKLDRRENIKPYFLRYEQLNDSLQTARNAAKNQFALIRYNTEKMRTNNLVLQKNNADARYQILRQWFFIGVIIIVSGVVIGILSYVYAKRKRQQQAATLKAVRQTQQDDSKKVHDTLANDIYYILKRVQHDEVIDRSWLENNIDEVYERARDISQEISVENDKDYYEKISARLTSFATEDTRVSLVGNSKELWQKTSPVAKIELKYVLQELMVNMRKHSQATNVVIKFEDRGSQALITYSDNGVGMRQADIEGRGLKNTGNRIKSIGGEITFESTTYSGLQIQISYPFA